MHTGDLGYITENGFIYISGRMKRFIQYVVNGYHKKIFSVDIEKALLNHPAVDNCAVVPVADPDTLQAPVAFIILKKEFHLESGTDQEFITYSAEHLGDGYRPVRYIFVDQFPLTKAGKVNYLELEKMAENLAGNHVQSPSS